MPNLGIFLKLLLIVALTFDSIGSSDGELSRMECPQVNLSLDLTGVGFESVPNGFVKNDFLTELILNENQIPFVTTETFSHVPELMHLSLASNKLTTLDLQPFSKMSKLKTLILNNNCELRYLELDPWDAEYFYQTQIRQVDPNSCNLQIDTVLNSVTHLYVENNNIPRISAGGSGRLPALTHLHLSHNPIAINEEFMLALKNHMPALTHLFLKDCNLSKLDASKLPTVTSLYLDENHISVVCNEYCLNLGLNLHLATQLTTLSMSHNEIARIDVDSFKDTTKLVTLDLSKNRILNIIEGTFDKLQNLEYLNLENNKLNRLDGIHTSDHLLRLNSLLLGGNNISHVSSEHFENMVTLETLMINDNSLSIIDPGTFSNLVDLKTLSLAGNQLSSIPNDSMPTSGSLISLNLDKNNFISTENVPIYKIPSLVSLSLKDNPLTTINTNWLKYAPENWTIFLGKTCP